MKINGVYYIKEAKKASRSIYLQSPFQILLLNWKNIFIEF